ncbi:soluble lytic murein transglycosylase [Litoreibacter ponti]|uniref:Soluble lytic murein transglycosylase n=1 Tax=Litoreibacter ponti TaxID=1510457 RepID=A0A2T6BN88_9RHOB|nr:lytic transglycosylase domain-containing protein [Litoreibacter ponti]PTX57535.1 soluble lytic murein transglycosylase [Litoreibacter ponti]
MVARVIGLVTALWLSTGAAWAQSVLADAVAAAGAGDWQSVDDLRPDIENQAARDVIGWMRLRGRQGDFEECRDFLARNGDWPGLPLLRLRCEYTIPRDGAAAPVLAFFGETLPQTGTGSLRLAAARKDTGRTGEATAEARRAWVTHVMSEAEHQAFVDRHGDALKDLHTVRLDMLLWEGAERAARRMFNLVPESRAKLALARIALRKDENGVDALIEAVPAALREDAGLAFERFIWRARKGRVEGAVEILMERSLSAKDLGRPIAWANRRRALARQLMRDGQFGLAYSVASQHFLDAGSAFADLEWLAGFIALRKLDAPAEALIHFSRFEAAVATPISLGRAGYWLGRTHTALGDDAAAAEAYAEGASYQSSFYGQLAAEAAGLPRDPAMAGAEIFPDWTDAAFTTSSVFEAALQLDDAGLRSLAERFLVHLGESQSREGLGQLAQVALEREEPHIALMIAKQAARQGHELYEAYFPLAVPQGIYTQLPPEFPLAIARRESEFDPVVVSGAGAMGLMQLMPGTAQEMAGAVGEDYARDQLLEDPEYNARLGIAYLEELASRFADNPVLMSIGYNAGPSRAERWPELYGDPRAEDVDVIDWIEGIPFRETRNYVMRVTESFAPYRARLNGEVDDISLLKLLKR